MLATSINDIEVYFDVKNKKQKQQIVKKVDALKNYVAMGGKHCRKTALDELFT